MTILLELTVDVIHHRLIIWSCRIANIVVSEIELAMIPDQMQRFLQFGTSPS